jgi:hypothetical protein
VRAIHSSCAKQIGENWWHSKQSQCMQSSKHVKFACRQQTRSGNTGAASIYNRLLVGFTVAAGWSHVGCTWRAASSNALVGFKFAGFACSQLLVGCFNLQPPLGGLHRRSWLVTRGVHLAGCKLECLGGLQVRGLRVQPALGGLQFTCTSSWRASRVNWHVAGKRVCFKLAA